MQYDFDKETNRLNTKSYKWDLLGEEYIPLWVADTDFEVPDAVITRIENRLKQRMFGYLLTGDEIYDAIRDWYKEEFNADIENKRWIRLVPSLVPALAVSANLYNGDSITNIPNYSMLLEAPKRTGHNMITVPLKNENETYSVDFEALEKAVTKDTRIFYLCNPHNPVGKVYTYDELKKVSEFAKKNKLIVVSDEAHCEVVYEGKHIPFFTVDEYAKNNSITLCSNGKMYNMPDLILAFAVIPSEIIRQEFEKYTYGFDEEHILNVEAGVACFKESREWQKRMLEYLKGNRDYLESEIARRFPKASFAHLQSTYLLWADFRAYGEDIDAKFFKENAKVYLSDGEEFGGKGYVRINFATRRAVLEEALERMENALKCRNL